MCNNGFGGSNNCLWVIILLIILWSCCGNGCGNNGWCGNNCGSNGCGSDCGCNNNCGC